MRELRLVLIALGCVAVFSNQTGIGRANHLTTGRGSDIPPPRAHQAHAETENFAVFSFAGGPDARGLAERAETLLSQLRARWLGCMPTSVWPIRCQVVVHEFPSSYARAAGHAAAQTKGSSVIRSHRGAISYRRIDVMAAGTSEPSALAHELTHVVLADRFQGEQPPRWLDEGIAMLSDSDRKRELHRRDCVAGLRRQEHQPLVEILTSQQPQDPSRMAAFYGQSLTLVEFLVRRRGSETLLAFGQLAAQSGYDAALRRIYGLDGIAELESVWRDEVLAMAAESEPSRPCRLPRESNTALPSGPTSPASRR